ncbi:MAG: Phosphoglycerate mutase [Candidatus Gottesmanbacteria bacterium GW2011_GWB1_43_11]|uniref:Phosphoglycerate mutase n=1 Tax=Candidatus Gottesmanbacteria bacterium GW2011_GWB1_43_11 TaxID=1618446 RepID=A0A0G1FI83_9BACT|nr:MAG: Phosphoglycerate mutase [Candidatus Gottesmanbacteria bacterium GW2011_GWA2_42_16]KKS54164.1 MAG: Phosphoglycerate mutase [Candidatus Gottesmanbacteria bacterium GW2011_GWA1_42_26]KKS80737.1 MAG: Phosphoglycerate mutase [Candidatus Gottesmanbacteria bacterium GW2011_GWC1_43_10]KKS86568.1 MAG: Phosphoglycerate mutase [Candidatus Gottesmanbacteria bacterium GW2011_GWB1_43_11]OGG09741.1 MAG: hypothetical protein A2699_04255 [Candidatus Gottesmanbacteria bacterium RIFCSPHIGHO2_01_FULL_43_15
MTTIYICRHGAYENPQKVFHGRLPGFPLSQIGKTQARKLSLALKSKPIAAIYSSPLTRAYQTAEIIARPHKLKITQDDRLMDVSTPLQGKPLTLIFKIEGNFYQEKYIKKGGERLGQVFTRIKETVDDILQKHAGFEVVVVTHGDLIMSFKSMLLDGKLPKYYPYVSDYVAQGVGYKLVFNGHKFSHLSPIFS